MRAKRTALFVAFVAFAVYRAGAHSVAVVILLRMCLLVTRVCIFRIS